MNRSFSCVVLFFILSISTLFSQTSASKKSIFDVLNYQEVVDVNLSFNFDSLLINRRNQSKIKGNFAFKDEKGQEQNWTVNLTLRGIYRRFNCEEMPPIRIDFKKKALLANGLTKFDDFKLVTLCMNDKKVDRNYLFKEYLCYKMYNELTPASFRVQLVRMLYKDVATAEMKEQYAFIVEDFDQLRSRLDGKKVSKKFISKADKFYEQERKLLSIYQYMIGNVDYLLHASKNVKYIKKEDKILPIPYDFDYAALVSPSYARLIKAYGQENFEDRIYIGFEQEQEELTTMLAYFDSKKKELLQTIESFELLPKRERNKMIEYCESFFENKEAIKFFRRPE